MADESPKQSEETISRIGKQLSASKTCPNKDSLIKFLKEATSAFPVLNQSKSLTNAVKPFSDSLVRLGLIHHKDKDVRLLVSICVCEIIRVLAPDPGFSETAIRDIFGLLLRMFAELDDVASPYFARRVKSLETVAKLNFCVQMLDTGCEDLVLKMFRGFFSVVRSDHPQSLFNSMSSIITCILEEKVTEMDSDTFYDRGNTLQPLLDVILQHLIKEKKGVASASFRLAVSVVENSGEKLESNLCQFLTSCILNRDAVGSVVKERYHEIILEIFQIAPQMLYSVIPNLNHELLTDQVDVRIKALNFIRKLIALPGQKIVQEYPLLFTEFLNRFSDKFAEVRINALLCAKDFCTSHQSGKESLECLSAIQGRLLDVDEKVRSEAVTIVCELAKSNLRFASPDLISLAAERLRDKKVLVRSKALKKLVELYQEYCMRCASGFTKLNEHMEQIPCKILMLCYEKDCQEFRPQSMELVLADLFPATLSVNDWTNHWIHLFSLFEPPHFKVLKVFLSQKRRLRDGLQEYLDLRNSTQENISKETERKMALLVDKMSSGFPDPAKAKSCFQKLNELKDNKIISVLQQFLNKKYTLGSEAANDKYLKQLSEQNGFSNFFYLLSTKCSFNIFNSKHVQCILGHLSGDTDENRHLKKHSVQLLLTIIGAFPVLLSGLEKQFQVLLIENVIHFDDQLLEMLARVGRQISIKFSEIYPSLENICIEGTRGQSKLAVSAIIALADTSELYILVELCKKLLDSLSNGQNVSTILQSLGCLAQHSPSIFEAQEKVITHFIIEEVLKQDCTPFPKTIESFDETSCCGPCKLKICGLKTLVRSFLPYKCTHLAPPISSLLKIIQQMTQNGGFPACNLPCERDRAHIRLAAAKSVLRLSRKWDWHISPQLFHLTVLMAKDPNPWVRRSFVSKVHKFMKNNSLPSRYACAFPIIALDSVKDLREEGLKYLEEFVRECDEGTKTNESMTTQRGANNNPLYVVVFLIHVLAHDSLFPTPDCKDEKVYARFLSPLFMTLEVLVNESLVARNPSNASLHLRSFMIAIKKADDAVNGQMTIKLHFLAELGIAILNSLNANAALPTPGLVLLPASLFKSSSGLLTEATVFPSMAYKTDASFIKKLVSSLKTEVLGFGSKRFYENSVRPSSTRQKGSNLKSVSVDELTLTKTEKPINEPYLGQKEQCRTSHHGSIESHNECLAGNEHKRDAAAVKSLLIRKNITSSGSMEEDVVSGCSSICAEPLKSLKSCEHVKSLSHGNIDINGEALIGKHIKLWSPTENCYYSGIVDNFDSMKSMHKITYDSGKVGVLSLDSEKWEMDLDDRPSASGDSSAKDQQKSIDDSEMENKKSRIRKDPQAVKRNRRSRDINTSKSDADTSKSEVTDVNADAIARRTRRRKVVA